MKYIKKKRHKLNFNYSIRIISGKYRNRKIKILNKLNIRVTGNRIKETLFNWLRPIILDKKCLDIFAGSGSLGIEAISNFASNVVFLEKNLKIGNVIKNNIKKLKLTNTKLFITDCFIWLLNSNNKFDIVFIDPPFYQGLQQKTTWFLEIYNLLNDISWIYIEDSIFCINYIVPYNWILYKKKIYSNVVFKLYFRSLIKFLYYVP